MLKMTPCLEISSSEWNEKEYLSKEVTTIVKGGEEDVATKEVFFYESCALGLSCKKPYLARKPLG